MRAVDNKRKISVYQENIVIEKIVIEKIIKLMGGKKYIKEYKKRKVNNKNYCKNK